MSDTFCRVYQRWPVFSNVSTSPFLYVIKDQMLLKIIKFLAVHIYTMELLLYTLPIQYAGPSLTLSYKINDVSITLSLVYLRVICRILLLVREYNRIFHQNIACITCKKVNSNYLNFFCFLHGLFSFYIYILYMWYIGEAYKSWGKTFYWKIINYNQTVFNKDPVPISDSNNLSSKKC